MKEFPKYDSQKTVGAVKVREVEARADGGLSVHLEDGFAPIHLTHHDRQHKPQPAAGWYAVRYSDGHLSFSPAGAFEAGYTRVKDKEPRNG